jgi:DNA-directed RNA polymerase subunit RPC12/RpoP
MEIGRQYSDAPEAISESLRGTWCRFVCIVVELPHSARLLDLFTAVEPKNAWCERAAIKQTRYHTDAIKSQVRTTCGPYRAYINSKAEGGADSAPLTNRGTLIMRTSHTYVCIECGREDFKDWPYRSGHDDDPARCQACFESRTEVMWMRNGLAGLRDKRTGRCWVARTTAVQEH